MVPGGAVAALIVLFLSISSIPATAHLGSCDKGFISMVVSEKGLNFVKDLLIDQAVHTLIPLTIPDVEKTVKIPLIGGVDVVISDITLTQVNVSWSTIHPGETGIVIVASGATASLRMNWMYSYSTWLVPIAVSDEGTALVEVEGMEIGLTMTMENKEGTLKLTATECGCYLKNIYITLDGGASWFYQGFVNVFEDQIRSAVEKAITKQISKGILNLDSLLQSLPKEVRIDDVVSLNVTFTSDPVLVNSSVEFDINGLFEPTSKIEVPDLLGKNSLYSISCGGPSTMLGISLDEAVFHSASALYYEAGLLHWIVDTVPDQAFLNTAHWKFIIPQLYKKFPNDDMELNISFTSPPSLRITSQNVDTTIYLDMIVDVLDHGETVPVACISVVVSASGVAMISGNNLAGKVELKDFSLSLKWSEVGNIYMSLIQGVMRVLLDTVLIPYVNLRLHNGFPLPIIHGLTVENPSILYVDSTIIVCTDVVYTKPMDIGLLPLYLI